MIRCRGRHLESPELPGISADVCIDFVIGLSVLARGSLQEKLRWAFSLYDINGDGYITKDELSKIVQSIYELMGKAVEPMIEDHTTRDHVDRVFQVR
ncbi:kv channel-interacting protein 4 [Trichonephila clavipes]|nr:kv channel-interacting protein 4 [Trichonephila clavipes]